jgi:sodium/potassium-transporting ATPase subunit alpha
MGNHLTESSQFVEIETLHDSILSDLDWQPISFDDSEVRRRLAIAPKTGHECEQAQCRVGPGQFGANKISPPPSHMLRKILHWIFGGFGGLLLVGQREVYSL